MTVEDVTSNAEIAAYEITADPFNHKIRLEISSPARFGFRYENVWIGTNDNVTGSRFDVQGIDELVTVLLYAKKLIEDSNGN